MVAHAMAEMLLLTEVVPLRMLNFDQLATAVSHLIPHLKSNSSEGYANAEFQVQRQVGELTTAAHYALFSLPHLPQGV